MSIKYLRFLAALPRLMAQFQSLPQYEHGLPEALGVLVVNLGTPDAPTPDAVRRYLAEFLFDPRVVEIPRPIWWLILHGYILRTRPAKSAEAYEKIWDRARFTAAFAHSGYCRGASGQTIGAISRGRSR